MHTEVILGDVGERLRTLARIALALLADAVASGIWAAFQWVVDYSTSPGLILGGYTYPVSPNLRLVVALTTLAPVAAFLYADVLALLRWNSAAISEEKNEKDLIVQVQGSYGALATICSARIARSVYLRRLIILFLEMGLVSTAMIVIVTTGGTMERGVQVAAVAALAAAIGYRVRYPFVAASIAFTFSMAAIASLLATLVLGTASLGFPSSLTAVVMLAGLVIGADLLIVWRVVRSGWSDRRNSRELVFGKHFFVRQVEGVVTAIGLDDQAPTRELVEKAKSAIRRVPGTPEDEEGIRDLSSVTKKCWRKYSQIIDLVAQGTRADIALYQRALQAEDRVSRFCEELLMEARQLGSTDAPRHRVYTGTSGRRQLKELLLEWNAALSEIIEREREIETQKAVPASPSTLKQHNPTEDRIDG